MFRQHRRPRAVSTALALTLFALVSSGCGSSLKDTATGTSADEISGSLTVSAAASLQAAFTEIKTAFTDVHPGVEVTLNFGASSSLAQQITADAPVDVFASADESNMTKVADADLLSAPPVTFVTNTLEIIVPKGNPARISTIHDLSESRVIYVSCTIDVPIGKYASQVLRNAGVTVKPSSLEPDVKGIVAKVTSGEADAGIVYATDVIATRGAADGVAIPTDANVTAAYPIAPIRKSGNPSAAAAWISFVTGPTGQTILGSHGFGPS